MSIALPRLAALLGVGFALVLSGCGSGSKASSPSGPSAVPAGATIQGTVNGSSASSLANLSSQSASSAGLRVTVVGTALSTTTDGSGRFVLTGVSGDKATLRFEGSDVDAKLEVSGLVPGQVITLNVTVAGSKATQESAQNGSEMSLRGSIQSVDAPNFNVAGRTIRTDASTRIKSHGDPIPFSSLKAGQTVEVEGRLQGDGSVLARQVTVEDDRDDDQNGQEVEFRGKIESLNAPTLTVAGRTVVTDGNTRIKAHGDRLSFGDLKVGQTVEIEGRVQGNGSVLAKQVTVEDDDDDRNEDEQEVEFRGTIQSLNAPNLTVSGRTVRTDGSTRIKSHGDPIPFSSLKVGQTVEVEGRVQDDGVVLAKQVTVED